VDQINATAVVLRQQLADEPPTIELDDALITGHLALRDGTVPVLVTSLHIEAVDDESLVAQDGRLHFELYIAGTEIAHGYVELATGARKVLVAA
jgi:hypothetical protein